MCSLHSRARSPALVRSTSRSATSSRPGKGGSAVADHRRALTAAGVEGIVEGEKKAEADCAEVEAAGRSRSSEAAVRDAMGAAGAGLGVGLLAMGGRCRSAEHGALAGAGQGCYMVLAEHWRLGRGEARRSALTAVAAKEAAYGFGSGFPIPAWFPSSARPGDR